MAFLAYANTFRNEFVADDWLFIGVNSAMREPLSLARVFGSSFWEAMGYDNTSAYYRPVVVLSKMLDFRLFGPAPAGFHLTNNLLHAATAVLCFVLYSRWTGDRIAAFAGAALFAAHPIHTQSVAFISGRTDVLATLFVLGTLAVIPANRLDSAGRPAARQAGAAALFLLALLSKEVALTLPLLLAASGILLQGRPVARELAGRRGEPYRLLYPLLAVAALLWFAMRTAALHGKAFASALTFTYDAWTRVLTIAKVYAWYFWKLLVPWPLNYESGLFAASGPADIAGLGALALLVAVCAAVLALRRRNPLVSFALAWLLITILPSSNIVPLTDLAKEHFAYLPSVGWCLLGAWLIAASRRGAAGVVRPAHATAVIWAMACIFLLLTWNRNTVWRDRESFWRDVVSRLPDIPDELIRNPHYRETVSAYPVAYLTLGNILAEQGRWEEAGKLFREGLRFGPDSAELHSMSGMAMKERGASADAEAKFRKALDLDPELAAARAGLGALALDRGAAAEALDALEPGVGKRPDLPLFWYLLGKARAESGNTTGAAEAYATLQGLKNVPADMLNNIAMFHEKSGNLNRAVELLDKALAGDSPHPLIAANRVRMLLHARRTEEARKALEFLRGIAPDSPHITGFERQMK